MICLSSARLFGFPGEDKSLLDAKAYQEQDAVDYDLGDLDRKSRCSNKRYKRGTCGHLTYTEREVHCDRGYPAIALEYYLFVDGVVKYRGTYPSNDCCNPNRATLRVF